MTYREFLNSLSNEDFAEVMAEDGLFNAACVENFNFDDKKCPHEYKKCKECILQLLNSEMS